MIDFCGIDIIVERRAEADVIRESLSRVLSLPTDRISVIDDIANYPEKDAADVVCVITPVAGEFAAILSIQNTPMTLPLDAPVDVAQRLAKELQLKCLTPMEGVDPYLMWLVLPDSTPTTVALNPKAMEEELYVVDRAPRSTIVQRTD